MDEFDRVFTDDDADANRARYALEAIGRLCECVEHRVRRQLDGKRTARARRAETAEAHCLFRLVVGRVPNDDERVWLDKGKSCTT